MKSQPDDVGTVADLVHYRSKTAEQDIKSAKLLLEAGDCKGANNRAYYGIFHAINAIHALHGKAYKRHKDAIGNFNRDYVKTGIFSRELGRKVAMAEEIRHASDYNDFYLASCAETEEQIATAEEILSQVRKYSDEELSQEDIEE